MSAAPTCLYCNDTGVLCTIETDKGEFKTYCGHCSAGIGVGSPPPYPPILPKISPTADTFRDDV